METQNRQLQDKINALRSLAQQQKDKGEDIATIALALDIIAVLIQSNKALQELTDKWYLEAVQSPLAIRGVDGQWIALDEWVYERILERVDDYDGPLRRALGLLSAEDE